MANSKHCLNTLQILGPEEGKRGESMLENTVYGVNTQPHKEKNKTRKLQCAH